MVEEELQLLTCELCDKKKKLLIKIEVAGESMLSYNKGICTDCFKNGEIEEKMIIKSDKYAKEQLRHAEERVKLWKQNIKDINKLSQFNKNE